ncbi:MAG: hypothetical protein N3F10_02965 [Candidatus Bathyarchaeota archaeon]|nr:hypothetical protein [Candidatus Bathyarchaeota archaeon]
MKSFNEEEAKQITTEFVKKRKNCDRVEISSVKQKGEYWIISGTCPINLEGHLWAEKFHVVLDKKGKVKLADFWLL